MSLYKEAQYLANKAGKIAGKIKDKEIPKETIAEDLGNLAYGIIKLRKDILDEVC